MVRLVCRHFAADERFARQHCHEPSPGIPLTLPFSVIFQGFSACYSYSNHSQDHGQWQVCVRVRVGACGMGVRVCMKKHWKPEENRETRVVWVCVLCGVARWEIHKNTRNIGKNVKTWSPSLARYGHPRTQKRSNIGHFPQRIVFTFPLGFADDFGPRS